MIVEFKVVADENIVLVHEIFSAFGDIKLVDGYSLNQARDATAQILLVRSVTTVNDDLLSRFPLLRFVGSATTGTDHIDQRTLSERGIAFAHAPGSNADSVVEYVIAGSVSQLPANVDWQSVTVGVIGHGTIGSRVARRFQTLGCSVIANDPPLAVRLGVDEVQGVPFKSLSELLELSDIVTVHVPLVRDGEYPTDNLVTGRLADHVRNEAIFINTSRGQVVTAEGLAKMAEGGTKLILDVWPNEPNPDAGLVKAAAIATPHIAGYSFDGKVLGTTMIRDGLLKTLALPEELRVNPEVEAPPQLGLSSITSSNWHELIPDLYDIQADSERFKNAYLRAESPAREFISQRKNYPRRRSFSAYSVSPGVVDKRAAEIVDKVLGLRMI